MKQNLVKTGRFLSFVLRHHPEAAFITLDEHGWADVSALIDGVNRTGKYHLDLSTLEEIVNTNNKQRYSFNSDHTRIRANQGHSIPVDVELPQVEPPEFLYHGTAEHLTSIIRTEGLKPMSRLYVHLSPDKETAIIVGKRHGTPHVFLVHAGEMAKQGYCFYLSVNGVWLTNAVPPQFLND